LDNEKLYIKCPPTNYLNGFYVEYL